MEKPIPIHCGDCRRDLERTVSEARAGKGDDPGIYCPDCVASGLPTFVCPHCGSLVCGTCGAIVESADDLGIG